MSFAESKNGERSEHSLPINDFDCLAPVYDELVSWAPYEKWVSRLVSRMGKYGLNPGGHVFDIGCGTGLSTLPLARHGYVVTGVDISKPMLKIAEKKVEDEADIDVSFHTANMLELNIDAKFDAAVCMHSGMDYFLSMDEIRRAMLRVRDHLRRGGLFAFDKCLDTPNFYRSDQSERRELSCGWAIFHYNWDVYARIFTQHCIVFWRGEDDSDVRRVEVVHKMLAVTVEELVAMAGDCGFEMLEEPQDFSIDDPGMGLFRAI